MQVRTSLLENVDGLAEITNGSTKVLVSVSGPIEPKIRQELPNMASLEIIVRPSIGSGNTRENLITDKLRLILSGLIIRHKYPRQLIQITVQVLNLETDKIIKNNFDNSPEDLKVFNLEMNEIINCCYLGLLDANISLYESFVSVLGTLNDNGELNSDPTLQDYINCKSNHLVVYSIVDDKPQKIVFVELKGEFTEKDLLVTLDKSYKIADHKFGQIKQFIEQKVDDDFIWKR